MAVAGTIITTPLDIGGGVTQYSVAWVSSAGGAVTENSLDVRRGPLRQVKFIPSAAVAPSDLYDVTLLDADGADVLVANGANLSATVASWYSPTNPIYLAAGALTPTIANAGNAKEGTIVLIVGP
jgi:hypothetical protein